MANSNLETVEILVYDDGTVEHKGTGFKGKACKEIADLIDNALKSKAVKETKTREYYQGGDGVKRTINRG